MSKAARTAAPVSTAPPLPFEDALHKLEAIVASMESDELPLETLLARFEEGTQLAEMCQAKLAEAEARVSAIVEHEDGSLSTRKAD